MSAGFLAQLAHRAVAGGDVRPRIAARFETPAPMEVVAERVSETPPAEPARAAPRDTVSTERTENTAPPATRALVEPAARLETRLVERVSEREAPRAAPAHESPEPRAPRLETSSIEQTIERATPAPAAPAAANTLRIERAPSPESTPATTRVETLREITTNSRDAAPPRLEAPRIPERPAALLVSPPAAPVARLAERRAVPEPPAPAPIEIVIGRIEIRTEAPAAAPRAPAPARRTGPSLGEYLRGREGHGHEGKGR